jgi:hypothetical protein
MPSTSLSSLGIEYTVPGNALTGTTSSYGLQTGFVETTAYSNFSRAIFHGGRNSFSGNVTGSVTNIISSQGFVSSDISQTLVAENHAGATYGGNRAIFSFGGRYDGEVYDVNVGSKLLISELGIVLSGTTIEGSTSGKNDCSASSYGGDKAIFIGGPFGSMSRNLVTNLGVIGSDSSVPATWRAAGAMASYGGDKAIFGYGATGSGGTYYNISNLITNTGTVGTDVTGVGTARRKLAAAGYGGDKAIFGYGQLASSASTTILNLVSNTGVVATDVSGPFAGRNDLSAATYGGDKAIFGFSVFSTVYFNRVSSLGIVSSAFSGIASPRSGTAAAGFGS